MYVHLEEFALTQIMSTKELAQYLKLHEITICKHAAEGKIPCFRTGRAWRFDKDVIDRWIAEGTNEAKTNEIAQRGRRQGKRSRE